MAVNYVAKSAFTSGTGALTVAAVAGVQNNDLLLLFVESANQAIATPSGWTAAPSSPQFTGTAAVAGGVRLGVFYKFATGADTTQSVADTGDHTTAIKMAFRGVNSTTPFNADAGSTQAATTAMSFPGVTTTVDNCLIVHGCAQDTDAASTATSGTPTNAALSTLTELHDQTVIAGAGGGLVVVAGYKATAGATGNTTSTGSTSVTHAYVTLALTPIVDPNVTVAITGLGVIAARGTVAPAATVVATGQGVVASQETVTVSSGSADVTVSITSQALSSAQGSVGKTTSKVLSSLQSPLATGSVGVTTSKALAGQTTSLAVGAISTAAVVGVSGQAASLDTGTVVASSGVVVSITGLGLVAVTGTTVSSAAWPITGLGQAVTLGTVVAVGTTAVALTGQSTSLSLGAVITSRTTLLSGTATALSTGLVVPSNSAAVSGLLAYADVRSLGSSRTITATGRGAALSLGSVSTAEEFFVTLSGVESTTLLGSLASYRELQLTGATLSAHEGYFYVGTPSVVQEYGVRFFDGLRTHGNQRNPYKSLRGLEYAMWGRVLAACEYVPYVYTTSESPGILRIGYGRPIVDTEEAEEANLSKNREAVWLNTKLTELYQRVLTANPTAELHEVLTSTLYYYQSECQK